MGLTKIEWAQYTFNPWIGCTKIDDLCAHCYAESDDKRRKWTPEGWGKGKPRKRTSVANWRLPYKWDTEAATHPWFRCESCGKVWGRETGAFMREEKQACTCGGELVEQRPRVFCASLADVFDEEVDNQWRWDLLKVINQTPNLDWLLLTKRPVYARKFLGRVDRWPWPNVWLGTSVGTQAGYEARMREFLLTPATVHFLSMEPLLEAIRFERVSITPSISFHPLKQNSLQANSHVDWVIVGGESGPQARPMHPQWAREIRDECAAHNVPFLFKQWGEWCPLHALRSEHAVERVISRDGRDVTGQVSLQDATCARVFRVGKHQAGRLLDGVEHNGFPFFCS